MHRRIDAANRPPLDRPLRSAKGLRAAVASWPDYLAELRHRGDVVEWRLGPMRETLFFHPDDIREIFAAAGPNGPLGRTLKKGFLEREAIIGTNGLVMSEGQLWKRQRRILQPGMHKQKIIEYTSDMVVFAELMCDRWGQGGVFQMQHEMANLTLQIMARTLFGPALTQAEVHEIKQAMDRQLLLNGIEITIANALAPQIPTPLRASLRNASNHLRDLFEAVIDRRRNEDSDARAQRSTDLLDMLLDARDDDGSAMSMQQLGDEMHNMFLGGYETSSNALTFIAALMARHPQVQDKIADEVRESAGTSRLSFEHISALPLTEAVVKEALRLYPPVFALPGHVVTSNVTLAGYDFTPGQRVNVCPYATHRDPRWFDNPDEFRPQRWLDGSTDDLHRSAWIPFGGGARVCYGQNFAMAEIILVLAVMIRRFEFSMPPAQSEAIEAKLSGSFMLQLKNDTVMLTTRSAASVPDSDDTRSSATTS